MSSNSTTARAQFQVFAARPGMFVIDSYDDVAAFIAGMDYAHNHNLLDGFQEWIQQKLGTKSPLVWSEYIKHEFDRLPEAEKRAYGEDNKRFLFSQIGQFFLQTDARSKAA